MAWLIGHQARNASHRRRMIDISRARRSVLVVVEHIFQGCEYLQEAGKSRLGGLERLEVRLPQLPRPFSGEKQGPAHAAPPNRRGKGEARATRKTEGHAEGGAVIATTKTCDRRGSADFSLMSGILRQAPGTGHGACTPGCHGG